MMSILKIVCCALTTAAILGGVNQAAVSLRSAATAPSSSTLVAKFVPEPTAPPVITQGSGTR
jgi:hypothetical protein